jgi:hypothetical protein
VSAAEFLRSHGWTVNDAMWTHPRLPDVRLHIIRALLQQAMWLERDLHDAKNALARMSAGLEGET